MEYVKLQIGCFLITLYISFVYIKQTIRDSKVKCNFIFDLMMFFLPATIFFDGATAWTVNHLDDVSPLLNIILHGCFFLFMNCSIFISFVYMLDMTRKVPKKIIHKIIISLPFIVSVLIIIIMLPKTYYIIGEKMNYSMGPSPIACYVSCFFYYIILLILTICYNNQIEKRKRAIIYFILILAFSIMIVQMFKPEVLWTSIAPTLLLLGYYITIEDPSLKAVQAYNTEMVLAFATLVENRDNSTGGHIKRTKEYVKILLDQMRQDKVYASELSVDFMKNMINAAPMHDLGKISTPDQILQKPGKLTDEEFSIMKEHAAHGGEIIKETFAGIKDSEFLEIAYNVARYHHEKWNGKGYPEGLKENEIPLCARIMAIADVFDAVSSKRCYREAMPVEECFKIIQDGAGKDFDPQLAKLFLQAEDKIIVTLNEEKKK